jgi:phosphoribosylamine-glycine ligase
VIVKSAAKPKKPARPDAGAEKRRKREHAAAIKDLRCAVEALEFCVMVTQDLAVAGPEPIRRTNIEDTRSIFAAAHIKFFGLRDLRNELEVTADYAKRLLEAIQQNKAVGWDPDRPR